LVAFSLVKCYDYLHGWSRGIESIARYAFVAQIHLVGREKAPSKPTQKPLGFYPESAKKYFVFC